MFERFTAEARRTVVQAQDEARELGAEEIEPVHILLGIVSGTGRGAAVLDAAGLDASSLRAAVIAATDPLDPDALAAVGVDLDLVRAATEAAFGPGALDRGDAVITGHLGFTASSKRALELSLRHVLARRGRRRDRAIDSGAVLAGVLAVDDPLVGRVLHRLGTDAQALRAHLLHAEAA